jgi:LruC domain-containing protein
VKRSTFLTAALAMAFPGLALAAPGDTLQTAIQKGVNFLTTDVTAFNNGNTCEACHRQGAAVFALSEAYSTGYTVNLTDANGLGRMATHAVNWQQTNGRWRHEPSWELANSLTSYVILGLSAYDARVSTRYSSNLTRGADWLLTSQTAAGGWTEEHGSFPTTYTSVETTARITFGLAQAAQRVDSTRATTYRSAITRAATWLIGQGFATTQSQSSIDAFRVAYVLLALKNAGYENDNPNVVHLRNHLLSRVSTATGRGWGYRQATAADAYNTGIVLYALCRAGERITDTAISNATSWLNNAQTNSGSNAGYWPASGFSSYDVPTTFALMGLSCFGSVGVASRIIGLERQQINALSSVQQTRTFTIRVENTGTFAAQDTFNIVVQGGQPGWSAALSANQVTITAGGYADITLDVTSPTNVPEAIPVSYTVVATSLSSAAATANSAVTVFTPPAPPTIGIATTTALTAGSGTTVTNRFTATRIDARVTPTGRTAVTGPGRGVVTFYVAGVAVGVDTDANGDGTYEINWTPGPQWVQTGTQDIRAIYSGIDQAGTTNDFLASYTSGTITLNLASDTDRDGIYDDVETNVVGSNPNNADTDGDGCQDGLEYYTMGTSPTRVDTDNDGFGDCTERTQGTNPVVNSSFPDRDGDGSSDLADAFPCDPTRSAVLFAPGENEYGTQFFEDNWPEAGDLDFNDAVVAYNYALFMNRMGQVTAMRLTIVPRAIGGNIRSGLALRLPASLTAVGSVTRTLGGAPESLTVAGDGETDVVVTVTQNLRELFAGNPENFINTHEFSGVRPGDGQQVIVEISFASPVTLNLAQEPFDLFFFRTFDRGHQVHRPQYAGTNTMNMSLFNTGVDSSNGARNFVDNYGLPFVIAVPELVFWTDESTPIHQLYPSISNFAASGGATDANFYEFIMGTGAYPRVMSIAPIPGVAYDRSCNPSGR